MEKNPATPDKNPLWEALGMAWELGYIIAIPAIIGSFGGAYLDTYLSTSPLFLLIGIGLALAISGIGVYRKTKHILKQ